MNNYKFVVSLQFHFALAKQQAKWLQFACSIQIFGFGLRAFRGAIPTPPEAGEEFEWNDSSSAKYVMCAGNGSKSKGSSVPAVQRNAVQQQTRSLMFRLNPSDTLDAHTLAQMHCPANWQCHRANSAPV